MTRGGTSFERDYKGFKPTGQVDRPFDKRLNECIQASSKKEYLVHEKRFYKLPKWSLCVVWYLGCFYLSSMDRVDSAVTGRVPPLKHRLQTQVCEDSFTFNGVVVC
jgi:hypothetical protein